MAVEFVDIPERGRRFAASFRVRLGDVDGRDEMHLETFARYLQDVAADDVDDSGASESRASGCCGATTRARRRFPRSGTPSSS